MEIALDHNCLTFECSHVSVVCMLTRGHQDSLQAFIGSLLPDVSSIDRCTTCSRLAWWSRIVLTKCSIKQLFLNRFLLVKQLFCEQLYTVVATHKSAESSNKAIVQDACLGHSKQYTCIFDAIEVLQLHVM